MTGSGVDGDRVRLHVVSGKGGTGKTTVAAALALALVAGGERVLLVEVEGRQGLAPVLGCPPLTYAETRLPVDAATGETGAAGEGELWVQAVDAEPALLEYLELFYKLGRAGRALRKVGALDFVTTVAPGLRDVLLTGKAYEAVWRVRRDGSPAYDAVVMDAPPTGRIAQFLAVHTELAGLAKVGPIGAQADRVAGLLRSPQTAVHLVTLAEELPVQETCDAAEELRALGLPLGRVVVNAVRRPLLASEQLAAAAAYGLDRADVAAGLRAANVDVVDVDDLAAALLLEGAEHAQRVQLERAQRERLGDLGAAAYELPALAGGVDSPGLRLLAGLLGEQRVRRPAAA